MFNVLSPQQKTGKLEKRSRAPDRNLPQVKRLIRAGDNDHEYKGASPLKAQSFKRKRGESFNHFVKARKLGIFPSTAHNIVIK